MSGELLTPNEWCVRFGVRILDPDGWRGVNGRPWADRIDEAEFKRRMAVCTILDLPLAWRQP